VFAIARFRTSEESFLSSLEAARHALAQCPGYLSGKIGINTDEPELVALITEWVNIGSYRRALSNFNVKMVAVPILAMAIDEPGGYIEPDSK
jgi:hypothetical protein